MIRFKYLWLSIPVVGIFASWVNFQLNYKKSNAVAITRHQSCIGKAALMDAELTGELLINRVLHKGEITDGQIQAKVLEQFKYLSSENIHPIQNPGLRYFVPSYEEPSVTILERLDVPYGFALTVDKGVLQFSKPEGYLQEGLTRGFTRKEDEAVLVRYRADFTAAVCMASGEFPKEVQLSMPRDPSLAYWVVSPENRKVIKWGLAKAHINPCSEAEMADVPDPSYYWYFWNPYRRGADVQGKPFACKDFFPQGSLSHVTAKLSKSPYQFDEQNFSLNQLAFRDIAQLRVSVAYGWTGTQTDGAAELAKLDRNSRDLLAHLKGKQDLSTFRRDKYREFSAESLLHLFKTLPEFLTDIDYQIEKGQTHLTYSITGRLKNSGRPLRLRAFWGPTDVFGKQAPAHWEFTKQALASDHVFVYGGHAGLGHNLNLAESGISEIKRRDDLKYQVIAIFSCFSYSYFRPELFGGDNLEWLADTTDLIYTGSSLFSPRVVMAEILTALDGPKSRGLASMSQSNDFFIVQRIQKKMPEKNLRKGRLF